MAIGRELTEVELNGGALYGICPNGHGDETGEIAAEVSFERESYPNCPLCGAALDGIDSLEVIT